MKQASTLDSKLDDQVDSVLAPSEKVPGSSLYDLAATMGELERRLNALKKGGRFAYKLARLTSSKLRQQAAEIDDRVKMLREVVKEEQRERISKHTSR